MVNGIVIGVDGILRTVTIDDSTSEAKSAGMLEAIGDGARMFDCVDYSDGIDVWVDDEGLYHSTVNVELSAMLREKRGQGAWFGAGLFLGVDDETGSTRSLTDLESAQIVRDWNRPREAGEYRFTAAFTRQIVA